MYPQPSLSFFPQAQRCGAAAPSATKVEFVTPQKLPEKVCQSVYPDTLPTPAQKKREPTSFTAAVEPPAKQGLGAGAALFAEAESSKELGQEEYRECADISANGTYNEVD